MGEALTIISNDLIRITMINNIRAALEEEAKLIILEGTLNLIITHKETYAVAFREPTQDTRKKKQVNIELSLTHPLPTTLPRLKRKLFTMSLNTEVIDVAKTTSITIKTPSPTLRAIISNKIPILKVHTKSLEVWAEANQLAKEVAISKIPTPMGAITISSKSRHLQILLISSQQARVEVVEEEFPIRYTAPKSLFLQTKAEVNLLVSVEVNLFMSNTRHFKIAVELTATSNRPTSRVSLHLYRSFSSK